MNNRFSQFLYRQRLPSKLFRALVDAKVFCAQPMLLLALEVSFGKYRILKSTSQLHTFLTTMFVDGCSDWVIYISASINRQIIWTSLSGSGLAGKNTSPGLNHQENIQDLHAWIPDYCSNCFEHSGLDVVVLPNPRTLASLLPRWLYKALRLRAGTASPTSPRVEWWLDIVKEPHVR